VVPSAHWHHAGKEIRSGSIPGFLLSRGAAGAVGTPHERQGVHRFDLALRRARRSRRRERADSTAGSDHAQFDPSRQSRTVKAALDYAGHAGCHRYPVMTRRIAASILRIPAGPFTTAKVFEVRQRTLSARTTSTPTNYPLSQHVIPCSTTKALGALMTIRVQPFEPSIEFALLALLRRCGRSRIRSSSSASPLFRLLP